MTDGWSDEEVKKTVPSLIEPYWVSLPHGTRSGCDPASAANDTQAITALMGAGGARELVGVPDRYIPFGSKEPSPVGVEDAVGGVMHDSGEKLVETYDPVKDKEERDAIMDIAFREAFGTKKTRRVGDELLEAMMVGWNPHTHPLMDLRSEDMGQVAIEEKNFHHAFLPRMSGKAPLQLDNLLLSKAESFQIGNSRKLAKDWFDRYFYEIENSLEKGGENTYANILSYKANRIVDYHIPEGAKRKVFFCLGSSMKDILERFLSKQGARTEKPLQGIVLINIPYDDELKEATMEVRGMTNLVEVRKLLKDTCEKMFYDYANLLRV